jgi:hypothetical protein
MSRRSRGFTFIELTMGLTITSLVMLALSVVCIAVAKAWHETDYSRAAWLSGHGATSTVQLSLRDARYLGRVVTGNINANPAVPASIFYWSTDDFGGTNDGKIEIAEMALLEFDPAAGTLTRYKVQLPANPTASQYAAVGGDEQYHLRHSDLTGSTAAADFKAYLTSSGLGQATPIARNLAGVAFSTVRADEAVPTGRPVVRFELRFNTPADATTNNRNSKVSIERGSVTLRAPTTQPKNF